MFKYSVDALIASKQQEKAELLLKDLKKHINLNYSNTIQELFNKNVKSYEYLTELNKISSIKNDNIYMVCIPMNHTDWAAKNDFKRAFDKLDKKSWWDGIPYIEFAFPEDYVSTFGESYNNIYIGFITKFKEFNAVEDCVIHYVNKLNKLILFM